MKHTSKGVALLLGIMSITSCQKTEQDTVSTIEYPETRKDLTVKEDYFGTEVSDPYRWLEDDMSEETKAWVKAENKVTFDYLDQIPYRDAIKKRMTHLWNYEKISAPFKRGEYTYFYKNDGLQAQSVLYRFKKDGDTPEVFLDPNNFSEDGTTSLAGLSFSTDGSLCTYQISEGGSDWRKIIIMDASSMKVMEDTLVDVKFSGVSWKGQEGFYYSSYDKPKEGSELSGLTQQHKLYFHKLGTAKAEDKLIFGGEETPRRYISGSVTEDNNYLVISAAIRTSGNELYIQDISKPNQPIINVVNNFDNEHSVVYNEGSKLFIETNLDAPNNRLVTTDFSKVAPSNWVDVIPESENVLNVSTSGGVFYAKYLEDAVSKVYAYDTKGKQLQEIALPGVGSASGFWGSKEDKEVYYTFTSYTYPSTIFKYEPTKGTSELYKKPTVDFDSEAFESKQVFYTSKDGTKIPMIITYKKGVELNGENPTILYGYGGFNISITPRFNTAMLVFLEKGGVYAVANLRGGGEYGEKWHSAGTKMNKQNVFDDFIAAAEYLIKTGYTSERKLAINGRSNGGLLVGAVANQRPDLFKVALPGVGVMDMLRYHKFTAGAGWAYDYGTSEDSKEMFEYLHKYSPYHSIKEGIDYPATLVTTADHDDRVVPAHSFKYAARLQEYHSGNTPVLIRIDTNAGHGAGRPTEKVIEEYTDLLAFTLWNMGYEELPKDDTVQ
ncbi:prolyl oligopeptidase family serine peptidase [Sediminitomix flava]|uniref:prolyl oligopeptidase n=1 Tax=Sediminitomix flava TaxID=379075 RepID=A0A315ZJR8_SEDFL|nr:prolyl oligopeptidase family serine peptidase [Sediminitomix flava]PWJ34151.1 prolyl oligopeptidase [Sediminitomix flava]